MAQHVQDAAVLERRLRPIYGNYINENISIAAQNQRHMVAPY